MISPAAREVCDELTPLLRAYAKENGLAPEKADTLTLNWDGEDFTVSSPLALDDDEYGSGKGPAPRPIHKAMTRLELDAEGLLEEKLDNAVAHVAEGVRF